MWLLFLQPLLVIPYSTPTRNTAKFTVLNKFQEHGRIHEYTLVMENPKGKMVDLNVSASAFHSAKIGKPIYFTLTEEHTGIPETSFMRKHTSWFSGISILICISSFMIGAMRVVENDLSGGGTMDQTTTYLAAGII